VAVFDTQVGEAFVGEGAEAAHLNTLLGAKGSAVETAWATSLATPSAGYARFVAVLQPGRPVKPMTLFVPKADVREGDHQRLTWGAAQAGVAGGVLDAVAEGIIDAAFVDELLLIAAVWVDWEAADAALVYVNNREATTAALRAGAQRLPQTEELLALRDEPFNPFFGGSAEGG
jgi:5,6,7,8-tetrahydromethanopterin hydro-lyase